MLAVVSEYTLHSVYSVLDLTNTVQRWHNCVVYPATDKRDTLARSFTLRIGEIGVKMRRETMDVCFQGAYKI
jgi:hypothetical protein